MHPSRRFSVIDNKNKLDDYGEKVERESSKIEAAALNFKFYKWHDISKVFKRILYNTDSVIWIFMVKLAAAASVSEEKGLRY